MPLFPRIAFLSTLFTLLAGFGAFGDPVIESDATLSNPSASSAILPRGVNFPCYRGRPKAASLTSYWVAVEGTMDDSGPLTGPRTVPLPRCWDLKPIARVANETARKCRLEGTCKLSNGRLLNAGGRIGGSPWNPCFVWLDQSVMPWGKGSQENPLVPWVSAASDDLPFGTIVYVKELDGYTVPGTKGKKHNGCLRVEDTGAGIYRCWLDWFVGTFTNYKTGSSAFQGPVTVTVKKAADCPILDYIGWVPKPRTTTRTTSTRTRTRTATKTAT